MDENRVHFAFIMHKVYFPKPALPNPNPSPTTLTIALPQNG
jgi:hypothetical protein